MSNIVLSYFHEILFKFKCLKCYFLKAISKRALKICSNYDFLDMNWFRCYLSVIELCKESCHQLFPFNKICIPTRDPRRDD